MAELDLVSEVASDAPLLLVAEDTQWLDRPTSDVLAFVARRIESDPIILLAATREGYPSALGDAGVPEHTVSGLDEVAAGALLDAVAPQLPAGARSRVLREAAGNPLALIELPQVVRQYEDEGWTSGPLPLTERLERAFAARVCELPEEARLVLLVAALDDGDAIGEILRAASIIAGKALDLDVAAPAAEARIIDVDLQTLRFRHPLIRSAVAQSAAVGDRRRVHEALADVLADQPDRRAWNPGAATGCGGGGGICVEARCGPQRGNCPQPPPARGGPARCRAGAARCRGAATARGRSAGPWRAGAGTGHVDRGDSRDAPARRRRAVHVSDRCSGTSQSSGDHDLRVDLLRLVASRAWWVDPGPEARQLLIEAARRLGDASAEDPRVFAIHAYADPVGHAQDVLARLRAEAAQERLDTDAARFFGPAALVVGAFDLGNDFLRAAVDGLRDEGRLGHLPRLLSLYSCMAARRGDWEVAITAGEEARRLAGEFAEPQWAAAADTAISLVAAPAPARSIQLEVVTQERYKLGVNRHSTSFTVGAVLECGTLTYRSVVSPIRTAAGLRVSEDHFSHP